MFDMLMCGCTCDHVKQWHFSQGGWWVCHGTFSAASSGLLQGACEEVSLALWLGDVPVTVGIMTFLLSSFIAHQFYILYLCIQVEYCRYKLD